MNRLSKRERTTFWMVFALVTLILLGAGFWVVSFVYGRVEVAQEPDPNLSPFFVDYSVDNTQFLQDTSLIAMGNWIRDVPETQNVQVLTGLTTSEVAGYMVNQVANGLQVDCSYCHNIQDFSQDDMEDTLVAERKATARAHLLMSQDLNQNWLAQLPTLTDLKQPSGAQVTCATCHKGQALFNTWADQPNALPDDYRLPLGNLDILLVNGNKDISLDTVQYNQYTMYHMNESMNVGCTHCHNSRYFPSNERPSKLYALHMLQMAEYIQANYSDVINAQDPSCSMCHNGAIIPGGAAKSVADLPAIISTDPTGGAVSQAQQ